MTHETDEECLEAEAFLTTRGEFTDDGRTITQTLECPTCGREWHIVYEMIGTWNPRDGEYATEV